MIEETPFFFSAEHSKTYSSSFISLKTRRSKENQREKK